MKINRRRLSAVFIEPNAQLRLAKPFLLLYGLAIAIILFLNAALVEIMSRLQPLLQSDADLYADIAQMHRKVVFGSALGVFTLSVFTIMSLLIQTHRVLGPAYAIKLQIQALLNGIYDKKVQLRKNDELKDLGECVNTLTDHLANSADSPP